MLREMFTPSAPFPTNIKEGVEYTEELKNGILIWLKIDLVIIPIAILSWIFNIINVSGLCFAILFSFGCPIIMILGFLIGCLQYLKFKECWGIVLGRATN